VLPHMPPDRRKFVLDVSHLRSHRLISLLLHHIFQLAAIYRMDTQTVDQEPHRRLVVLNTEPFSG
jgi:hypothetical protein